MRGNPSAPLRGYSFRTENWTFYRWWQKSTFRSRSQNWLLNCLQWNLMRLSSDVWMSFMLCVSGRDYHSSDGNTTKRIFATIKMLSLSWSIIYHVSYMIRNLRLQYIAYITLWRNINDHQCHRRSSIDSISEIKNELLSLLWKLV